MKSVVDANILFSFFRENPVRFIILNSKEIKIELFSPAYVLSELDKNIPDLIKYSKLNLSEIRSMLEELKELITTFPSSEYKEFESKAEYISPHKTIKDVPYFALALKLECPIWSNEPAFKRQSSVKVFNTKELVDKLKSEGFNFSIPE